MQLSIVTTMYQSAPFIEEFYRRASASASALAPDWELILVNDGSPDQCLEIARGLSLRDGHVRVVDLARNFGHHRAIMAGLEFARGDRVFLIDCDLEEAPEEFGRFWTEMERTRADVVYGVQSKRKGNAAERISGALFYWLFNQLSDCPIPRNLVTARLMTRRYVTSLLGHRERELFLAGVWVITGFDQRPLEVEKGLRGTTSYSLRRRFALAVNAITSFSSKPLVLIFYTGLGISAFAVVAAGYLLVRKLMFGDLLVGWPSLMVSVWLLGGATIFSIGLVGMYLSRVFMEVKQRPYTIVREVIEGAATSGPES